MLEVEAQTALKEAAANFPAPLGSLGGLLMNIGVAPLGSFMRPYSPPKDALVKEVSRQLTTDSAVHKMFSANVYQGEETRVAALIKALPIVVQADAVSAMLKKERREPTAAETTLLQQAVALRDELVQVDVHESYGPLEQESGYVRPALLSTERRLHGPADFGEAQAVAASA